jgi:hypothetical protein
MENDTKDSMEEFKYKPPQPKCPNKPLFMPVGSVRALMALTVTGSFVAICLYTKNIEALAVIATMIAKDYFESKKV